MKRSVFLYLISSFVISCSSGQNSPKENQQQTSNQETTDENTCSWCGTSEAPENVTWNAEIPIVGESKEILMISGTVYLQDGKTPAKDVIIYVYHTNSEGIYPKNGDETENGKYHGYLRAWMKTDSSGRYQFETFRPAPYNSHEGEPAHIHYNVQAPGYPEYWLTALWFDGDPRITDEYLKKIERSGGFSNVTTLTLDSNNVLQGERNIILEEFD